MYRIYKVAVLLNQYHVLRSNWSLTTALGPPGNGPLHHDAVDGDVQAPVSHLKRQIIQELACDR